MMFVRLGIVNAFLEFVGALAVKDLVLSLLWLGSLLWCRFDPWPGNFCMQRAQPKKKKKKKIKKCIFDVFSTCDVFIRM